MVVNYASSRDLQIRVRDILNFHRGRKQSIKRWDLVREVFGADALASGENDDNPFDRRVRDAIEALRDKDEIHICNMGDGNGYFIAATREEWESFKAYYLGPQSKKYVTVRKLDAKADEYWGKQVKPTPEGQEVMFA